MPRQIRQDIVVRGIDKTTRGFRSVEKNITRMERFVRRVQTTLLGFVGINIAVNLVRDLTRISDVAVELDAKMALVTTSFEDQAKAQSELTKVSLQSGSSLEANTILFTRLARPVRALGFALEDTLQVTKLVAQGLRISGASQQESASVIRQLSQAFQSGVLRGEEFNALMENGGRIAIALADGLGVTTGELRKMSKAGELSTARVINAFKKQAAAIDRENAKLPLTIGRAIENIRTKYLNFAKDNKEFNRSIADGINAIAQNMDTVLNAAGVALIAVMGRLTQSFIASIAARVKQNAVDRKAFADEQIRNKARELAILRKTQLESAATVAKTRATIAELAQERAILTAKSNHIATLIALNQVELANAKTRAAKVKLNQAILVQQAELVIVEKALTTAITAETAAVVANSVAKKANAASTLAMSVSSAANLTGFAKFTNAIGLATTSTGKFTSKTGKLLVKGKAMKGLFARLLAIIPRLGAALLGLPGLILLVGGSIIGMFIEWKVAWEALLVGLKKITASLKLVFKLLTSPFSTADHLLAYKEELDGIDSDFQTFTDDYIANQQAQAEGFADAEAKKSKARQQALQDENRRTSKIRENEKEVAALRKKNAEQEIADQEAISAHADDVLEARTAVIESELALEKDRIAGLMLSQADYDKQVTVAEAESAKRHSDLVLQSIDEDSARWSQFFTARREAETVASQEQFNIVRDSIDQRLVKEKEAITALEKGRNDFAEQVKSVESKAAKEHFDLIADQIKKEGDAFRESRLDELTKTREYFIKKAEALRGSLSKLRSLRKGYIDSIRSGEQEIRELERRSAQFLQELNADNTTSAGKAASAQDKLASVQAELRRASQLDQVKNAEEIKSIRANALTDLESIATAEKSRGEALKVGSLEAVQANTTQRDAAELYKSVVSDTLVVTKQAVELDKQRKANAEKDIKKRVESLQQYESAIAEVDKQIKIQREIVIDLDSKQALDEIGKIDVALKKLKDKTITVTTVHKSVTKRQGGGFGGEDVKLATGGYPRRKDKVPGSGSGDKVKALLEPEEFIVKKSSSKVLGADILNLANQNPNALLDMLDSPVKRKFGGYVGRDPSRNIERLIANYEGRLGDAKRSTNLRGGVNARTSNVISALTLMIERAKLLRGKDSATFSEGRSLLDDYFRIKVDGSANNTDGYLKVFAKSSTNNDQWAALLENAKDYVTPEPEPTPSTEQPKQDTVTEAATAASTLSTSDSSGGGSSSSAVASAGSALRNVVSAAIQSVAPSAIQAASVRVSSPEPVTSTTGSKSSNGGETITVKLLVDGETSKGTFDDNDSTKRLIDVLRQNGQVVA